MTKTFIYLLLAFALFGLFTLPQVLNPHQGWIFIIEEVVGFVLLLFGFFVLRRPVIKVVKKLNESNPWNKDFFHRFLLDIGMLTAFSVGMTVLILSFSWGMIEVFGKPEFYIEKLRVKQEIGRKNAPPPPHGRKKPPIPLRHEFSVFNFTMPLLGGSFFLFGLLFGMEESFEYNKRKQAKLLAREQIAKEHALSKANALKNQLNPHFMFNTLNVLSGLIHEDVDKADKFLKKLSEIYRYTLEQSEEIVATVEKELSFIQSYVYLQKIRFEDKLTVDYDIPEDRMDWLIPSLTLELLVENAIKHNVIDSHAPLYILIKVEGDQLKVINNYQLRKDSFASTGIGIKNLEERLKLLELGPGSFTVIANKFIATIPMLKPE